MAAHDPRHGGMENDDDDDNDDDPVVASYSVFLKPQLPQHRNLVVLQYVNKTAQDPAQIRVPRITELRVKPDTGMYEVDVPIDTTEAYDRNKGIAWGVAIQKSMESKKGGSLGLAGGFSIVPTSSHPGGAAGRGRRAPAGNDADGPLGWAEAARQDKVLRTQTFGGMRSAGEGNTRHMIGVFQGKNLHLTPVSAIVHLRPVPHHIDAATEQERLARGSGSGAASSSGGGGGGGGADAKAGGGRAIHMTIKSAMDDGGVATETMVDRLRKVQSEPWRRMGWVHDEAELAWEAYNECLLLRAPAATAAAAAGERSGGEEGKGKGKGKAEEAAVATDAGAGTAQDTNSGAAADLAERVGRLKTDWGEQEFLEAMSGVRRGTRGSKGKGKGQVAAQSDETQRLPGRPAESSSTAASASVSAAPGRAARARAANRGGATEVD